mmetsp:Transcript_94608/g.263185  ORF Transcript_94608/g.263185 Transcript_94608/m.263185 type:complete len:183 (+) Transcript_94608:187-735(+)
MSRLWSLMMGLAGAAELATPRGSLANLLLGVGGWPPAEPRGPRHLPPSPERSAATGLRFLHWGTRSWRRVGLQRSSAEGFANLTTAAGTALGESNRTATGALAPERPELAPWHGTGGKSWDAIEARAGQRTLGRPRQFLGVPKIHWALIVDVLAMLAIVACIPFILTIAKRRRPMPASTPAT